MRKCFFIRSVNVEEKGLNEKEKGELWPTRLNLDFILCLSHSEGEKLCNEPLNLVPWT